MQRRTGYKSLLIPGALLLSLVLWGQAASEQSFRFAILGDRTGEPQPGVYQQVWKEIAAEHPDFVLSVGDTIQGTRDATAEAQWRQIDQLLTPYRRYSLYLAPGNHDVWSQASERLFLQHARGLHYSFDYGDAHFTVLDNSRADALPNEELNFLESDLKAHATQRFKFVVSHRPSWLLNAALQNPNFRLHQLARRYGVQYVIAGHLHRMVHVELDGVNYVSMPSSGGHLRASEAYDDGWFFAHALVEVKGKNVAFDIQEAAPPHGQGRVTLLAAWGLTGVIQEHQTKAAGAAR